MRQLKLIALITSLIAIMASIIYAPNAREIILGKLTTGPSQDRSALDKEQADPRISAAPESVSPQNTNQKKVAVVAAPLRETADYKKTQTLPDIQVDQPATSMKPDLPGALILKAQDPPAQIVQPAPTSSLPTALAGVYAKSDDLNPDHVRERTNLERIANGLGSLRENSILTKMAEEKARDLLAKQYFAHVSPSGVDIESLAHTFGYEYLNIGENLALGNFTSSEHVVTAWMNSPGHRANILNTHYTEIGIATFEGIYEGDKVWFAVQEFGRPQSDCPSPNALLKQKITIYTDQLTQLEKTLNGISAKIEEPGIDAATHNALAKDYNTIVSLYNSLVAISKVAIADFNTQADAFNTCIGR